jgi:hypothetical protein
MTMNNISYPLRNLIGATSGDCSVIIKGVNTTACLLHYGPIYSGDPCLQNTTWGPKLTPQRAYLQANFTRTFPYCGELPVLELLQVKMFFCYGTYSPSQQIISLCQVRMRPHPALDA